MYRNCYFICNHPTMLVLFNMIAGIKKKFNSTENICVISQHPYFQSLDYMKFTDNFSNIIKLPYMDYHHNIIKGFIRGYRYKNLLKSIEMKKPFIVFVPVTGDLVINLFIKYIRKSSPNSKIIALGGLDEPYKLGRKGWLTTIWDCLYALLLDGYFVYSFVGKKGVLLNREYFREPYDYKIISIPPDTYKLNNYSKSDKNIKLPYPIFSFKSSRTVDSKKSVIFFGDYITFQFYPEIEPEYFYEKINLILKEIKKKYLNKGITLYYKPHPLNKESRYEEKIDFSGFEIFKEKFNTEMVCSLYKENIVSAYAVFSASCMVTSNFGIPSYHLYNYCVSDNGLKQKYRKFFKLTSPNLLKIVNSIEEIGSIDDRKTGINVSDIEREWTKIINNFITE